MNLILIEKQELTTDHTVVLTDHRGEHIKNVLRCSKNDEVRVGLVNGPTGSGRILDISPGQVVLKVDCTGPPPPRPLVDLILALPRPIMLKRILTQAASMGVDRIFLIKANRVEKSFFQSTLLKKRNFKPHLLFGLEQAMDTLVPQVSVHERFRPFVEDLLPEIVKQCPIRLAAHPDISQSLLQAVSPPITKKVILAIGPEGGWVDFEIEKFKEQKLIPFNMGPRILRVETAVVAILAQLDLCKRSPVIAIQHS